MACGGTSRRRRCAQGAFYGAAPGLVGGGHLDQLGDEGQGVGRQAQLLGQLGAELGEVRWQVGARRWRTAVISSCSCASAAWRCAPAPRRLPAPLAARPPGFAIAPARARLGLQLCQLRSAKGLGDGQVDLPGQLLELRPVLRALAALVLLGGDAAAQQLYIAAAGACR